MVKTEPGKTKAGKPGKVYKKSTQTAFAYQFADENIRGSVQPVRAINLRLIVVFLFWPFLFLYGIAGSGDVPQNSNQRNQYYA